MMNRRMRAGVETTVLSMSDWIDQILGITSEKLTAQTEQANRKFELGYEEWLSLAMEYSDDHNRIMNEFWRVFASTQTLSLGSSLRCHE